MKFRGAAPAFLCLLPLALACAPSGSAGKLRETNVVLIVIDTLRADHLPVYGDAEQTAPYLTRIAERGVVFEHAHASSSWTAPSTASLFTSLHPIQHGVVTGFNASRSMKIEVNRLPDGTATLAEVMQRHGYRTFAVTDNHNISERLSFDRGFDFFENRHNESATAVNEQVLQWKDEIRRSEKYFLYLHYMDPHWPYVARSPLPEGTKDPSERDLAAYDTEIRFVDEHIETLSDRLGWQENTLVIVVSDHGEEFMDHGETMHGKSLHSEVLDVPDRPRSLYAHLYRRRGEVVGDRGPLLMKSLIRGDLKLIRTSAGQDLLYDLAADPLERENRIEVHAKAARQLAVELRNLERLVPRYASDTIEVTLSEEDNRKLRALGYVQ